MRIEPGRGVFRTQPKIEDGVSHKKSFNSWKVLTIFIESSILDVQLWSQIKYLQEGKEIQ